jgi:hypothetical protein
MTRLSLGALALAAALALGASSAFAAGPPPPNFSFGLTIGNPPPPGPPPGFHRGPPPPDDCLSPRQIFRLLSRQGYSDFRHYNDAGDDFLVDARRGFRWYELDVDSCSGDILDRHRLYGPGPIGPGGPMGPGGPGGPPPWGH